MQANLTLQDDEYFYCSPEGLQRIGQVYDKNDPQKNINWTTDYTLEMPIRMKKKGPGSEIPQTLIEIFENTLKQIPEKPALSVKKDGKWKTLTFKQYYEAAKTFGKALISLKVSPYKSVNILGYNSPEWVISFYGSIFGFYLPVGVYTTNQAEACQYVAENSDCEVAVVENEQNLQKYLKVIDRLPQLKHIIVYSGDNFTKSDKVNVLSWNEIMEIGKKFKSEKAEDDIENRMKSQKPGNCCTLVYTSGTTGMPKGVMLSHDNYTWTSQAVLKQYDIKTQGNDRIISYLPLSHVAAQNIDIVGCILSGCHTYFAEPTALQGSLIDTLKEVKPTFFFSVPRVWEKIEEKMKEVASSNGWLKTQISTWAKGIGILGAQSRNQNLPFGFGIAKSLVFDNVRKALGLQEATHLMYGAAPLSPTIRQYFLSLNMYLISAYGMSESAGPQCLSDIKNYDVFDSNFYASTGASIQGTNLIIAQPDKDGNGEICYRGRNRFMGYFKNEEATRQTIDQNGFLHSGDVGKLDKNGNLSITGRIKELIITAGGENVAPVLIENILKEQLKFISNAVVIGDNKKYLSVLLTFKYVAEGDILTNKFSPETLREFEILGSQAKNVEEARKCQKVMKAIQQGIDRTNQQVISKAQRIQKFAVLEGDFTIQSGDLTPTLKLKRNVVSKKYEGIIEQLYIESKL
ncbi:hypothetical protein IMG5_177990 [Ichthyophthirius multifiliis]|uniref:AMP-dependent synthetase/ligase domain-containing protein n=1 Tax=Ichthyophthirius multifiliis TaxID=5932 RepID=G0R2H1_ICHMU|nr:hypothetical protein IMG5_177990 [Ichthyophthirius multifiliis]EGR28339.1 hypothetical protein IMG5_177990 [Ichthyophthirius multifiliis]|eukprot:XP_004027684.1 hypothetical protein IMG5_177990 [Ichthyophthirius multifiliis]